MRALAGEKEDDGAAGARHGVRGRLRPERRSRPRREWPRRARRAGSWRRLSARVGDVGEVGPGCASRSRAARRRGAAAPLLAESAAPDRARDAGERAGRRRLLEHDVAFVPPMPNELTPARRGAVRRGQGSASRLHVERAAGEADLRVRRAEVQAGRDARRASSASAVLIRPATPARRSRCPMLRLHRADGAEAASARCRPEGLGQRRDLDRIAERRCRCRGPRRSRSCRRVDARRRRAPRRSRSAWPSTLGAV